MNDDNLPALTEIAGSNRYLENKQLDMGDAAIHEGPQSGEIEEDDIQSAKKKLLNG